VSRPHDPLAPLKMVGRLGPGARELLDSAFFASPDAQQALACMTHRERLAPRDDVHPRHQ
jgi:hypothetical protein